MSEFLDGLYDGVLYRLTEFVGRPLKQPSTTVRGVVRQDPRTARVFLLAESDFDSSFAVDVPLVDANGRQYPPDTVTALLRAVSAGRHAKQMPESEIVVGRTPVTVFDGSAVIDSVAESDAFQDYVRVSLFSLVGSGLPAGRATTPDLGFAGFLILNDATVRYYFHRPGGPSPIGVDCPLRTRTSNRARTGGASFLPVRIKELFDTGIMDGLLVPGMTDDFCQAVYDATAHL